MAQLNRAKEHHSLSENKQKLGRHKNKVPCTPMVVRVRNEYHVLLRATKKNYP